MYALLVLSSLSCVFFGNAWNFKIQFFYNAIVLIGGFFFVSKSFVRKSIVLPADYLSFFVAIAISAFSIAVSPVKNLITGEYINFLCGCFLFFLSINLKEEIKKRNNIIYIFLWIIILLSFYQLFKADEVYSTFKNSNTLAFFSILAVSFCLENKKYLLSILLLFVILMAKSIGAILSITIVSIYYFLNQEAFLKYRKKIIAALIFLAFIGILFIDIHSISDRLNWWMASIRIFSERPLFGWGIGAFNLIYRAIDNHIGISSIYVHNYYLETLLENGIFFFLIWFYWIFKNIFSAEGFYKYGLIAALLHSFFDFGLSTIYGFYFFMFLFGIGAKGVNLNFKNNVSKYFISLALFIFVLKFFNYSYENIYVENTIYKMENSISNNEIGEAEILSERALNRYPLNYDLNKMRSKILVSKNKADNKELFKLSVSLEKQLIINPYDIEAYSQLERIYGFISPELLEELHKRKYKYIKWR